MFRFANFADLIAQCGDGPHNALIWIGVGEAEIDELGRRISGAGLVHNIVGRERATVAVVVENVPHEARRALAALLRAPLQGSPGTHASAARGAYSALVAAVYDARGDFGGPLGALEQALDATLDRLFDALSDAERREAEIAFLCRRS